MTATENDTTGTETLHVDDMPDVPGLRLRRFRGEPDYPGMVDVIHGHGAADGLERTDTVEDLRHNYSHLSNCDPRTDMVMAEVDGRLVAYGRVEALRELDGAWVFWHFVFLHPDFRRRRIGSAMLRWLHGRAREIAAARGGEPPLYAQTDTLDTQVASIALLRAHGYEPIRFEFEMLRPSLEDIPDVPLPEGLEVRPVKQEHLRAIWDADIEAFRDHWGATERTEEEYQAWLSHPVTFQPELWRVAWDGDEVAGQVRSFIDHSRNSEYGRKRGYTEFISTRRPWRKRGLARALIAQSLRALREAGMEEAALGVDVENPTGALRVYESVGFRPIKSGTTYRRSLD